MISNELFTAFALMLGAIEASALFAGGNAGGIVNAPDNMITDARQILNPAAADQNNGMFLQIVSFARDVSGDFHAIGKPHPGDFAQS